MSNVKVGDRVLCKAAGKEWEAVVTSVHSIDRTVASSLVHNEVVVYVEVSPGITRKEYSSPLLESEVTKKE
jgi:hypothetical protein